MNDDNAIVSVYELGPETSGGETCVADRVPNAVRCPFYDKPVNRDAYTPRSKNAKRTQRHRSTAQSRLDDMTVGDIRYCFQQLRNAGKDLRPEMMLYNGQSAGEFALKYLRETSTAMRKRRKRLLPSVVDGESAEGLGVGESTRVGDGIGREKRHGDNLNVLEF